MSRRFVGTPAAPDQGKSSSELLPGAVFVKDGSPISPRKGVFPCGWLSRVRVRMYLVSRGGGPRHLRQSRLLRYVKAPQPVSSWQFQYGRFQRVLES